LALIHAFGAFEIANFNLDERSDAFRATE
jgi:hypothetical protein